uniref:Uncharacterized protein n=1 Tax=Globisporangium ultimum (strain ATCC 200006 / CBS 805.95 / DAOM BR144) TaxID=431595 RepID=K3X6Z3_GLOUD
MQRVAIWASVACAALNSCQLFTAASSHTAEPVVIFTQAASTGASGRIIVPVLFDFLPVVLQLDVHRDVAFQLRRFCAFHGLDATKCSVLHEALSELVNMDKWCAHGATQQLPSFMIVKNFLVSATSMSDSSDQHQRHGGASYRWIQDEAGNLAIDLCRFVENRGIDVGGTECIESLGGAIQRSFEWLNSLPSCDAQEATETAERASAIKSAAHSTEQLTTRISAVEQLIADIVADRHRNLTLQKTQDDTSSSKENCGQQSDALNEWKEVSASPSQIQSAGEGHEASEYHETESTATPTHVETTDPQDEVTASLTAIEGDNTDGSSTVSFAVKEEESEVTELVDGQTEDAENTSETATVLVGTDLMHDADMKAKSNEESPKNDCETEAPATRATVETEESQQAARSLTAKGDGGGIRSSGYYGEARCNG